MHIKGNVCPACGKEVMPYKRFIREAEPYKTSSCGSCGAPLRRSPAVFLFLFVMIVVLCIDCLSVFFALTKAGASFWIILAALTANLAIWVFITNYLSWRFISWIETDQGNKTRL
jgi:predicted RNA-binding Zn-ribbon protein involved in translation (DUF1610 family)